MMDRTPAPADKSSSVDSDEESSSSDQEDQGFTPCDSFESDVMGITPYDSSS